MPKSQKLIFFGNEQLASGVETSAPVLRSLLGAGFDVAHLVLSQADQSGRQKKILAVEEIAAKNNVPVTRVQSTSEISKIISDVGPDIGVLAAFGKIIPKSILNQFGHGILNIHPSLLPAYRGSTPIESAILNADPMTGVSIMRLAEEMDAGPIFGFTEIQPEDGVSKQALYEQLSEAGAAMLVELLPSILDGHIKPLEQDDMAATYCSTLSKADGQIDWTKPAIQIEREVRAYLGWPGSRTVLADKEVTITKARAIDDSGTPGVVFPISKTQFGIYCGQKGLEVLSLKPAGKSIMSAQAFIAGNKDKLYN